MRVFKSTTQQTTSHVAANTLPALCDTAQSDIIDVVAVEVPAKPTKPAKTPLDSSKRKENKADKTKATIGQLIAEIGDTIGNYSAESDMLKIDVVSEVSNYLKQAMKIGLTVEMLKAPTKSNPSECYTILVDAINTPRVVCGLPALKDATRDNYLSRIRAFVRDRGAKPLDLFGNLKVKATKPKTKPPVDSSNEDDTDTATLTEQNAGSSKNPEVKTGSAESMIGLPALQKFLAMWLDANQSGVVSAEYREMACDLKDAIDGVLGKK